jgi:hypothetical protein
MTWPVAWSKLRSRGNRPAGTAPSWRAGAQAEGASRILAGQPRDEICQVLAAAARQAFDLLEPSLGGYGIRA